MSLNLYECRKFSPEISPEAHSFPVFSLAASFPPHLPASPPLSPSPRSCPARLALQRRLRVKEGIDGRRNLELQTEWEELSLRDLAPELLPRCVEVEGLTELQSNDYLDNNKACLP